MPIYYSKQTNRQCSKEKNRPDIIITCWGRVAPGNDAGIFRMTELFFLATMY